jgi:hypothetical protein
MLSIFQAFALGRDLAENDLNLESHAPIHAWGLGSRVYGLGHKIRHLDKGAVDDLRLEVLKVLALSLKLGREEVVHLVGPGVSGFGV